MEYKVSDKAIFKYKLAVANDQELTMPLGAKILKVDTQHGDIVLWALVSPREQQVLTRKFKVFGTGHPITESNDSISRCKHLDSVQQHSGTFVWHVFELDSPE